MLKLPFRGKFGQLNVAGTHYNTILGRRGFATVAREGFTQSVNQWHSKKFLEAEGTADVYRSNLNTYWQRSLKAQGLPTIDD
jgi:hypothetical protein